MNKQSTWTRCPECGRVLPAQRIVRGMDVYLASNCPSCGKREELFFKNAAMLKRLEVLASKDKRCTDSFQCVLGRPCNKHLFKTANLMLNVTDRCDMSCPVCLASANEKLNVEPTTDQIFKALPEPTGKDKPNLCIIGGEPTLRDDLPDIVRSIVKKGYIPRLNTNGRRLARDAELVQRLMEAGLKWIILQFDGVTDDVYLKLRGTALLEEKRRLTKTLLEAGFKVQYAVMVAKGVNDLQISDILDEAERQGVFWVSLYPASAVNRNELNEETHLYEVLEALERTTGGRVRMEDLLLSMKLFGMIYKVTKKEMFRQKALTIPTVLFKGRKGLVPFTRIIGKGGWLQSVSLLKSLATHIFGLLDFETGTPPRGVLFLTIKKFQGASALDLVEASDCQMSWIVPGGVVAFDMFNVCWRDRDAWKTV
ncbi:MAG: radical SAM protein [Deltaproteobacteria bacterium]|nr:radical SAM protein [Deltaproteobacteria bacterium]